MVTTKRLMMVLLVLRLPLNYQDHPSLIFASFLLIFYNNNNNKHRIDTCSPILVTLTCRFCSISFFSSHFLLTATSLSFYTNFTFSHGSYSWKKVEDRDSKFHSCCCQKHCPLKPIEIYSLGVQYSNTPTLHTFLMFFYLHVLSIPISLPPRIGSLAEKKR